MKITGWGYLIAVVGIVNLWMVGVNVGQGHWLVALVHVVLLVCCALPFYFQWRHRVHFTVRDNSRG